MARWLVAFSRYGLDDDSIDKSAVSAVPGADLPTVLRGGVRNLVESLILMLLMELVVKVDAGRMDGVLPRKFKRRRGWLCSLGSIVPESTEVLIKGGHSISLLLDAAGSTRQRTLQFDSFPGPPSRCATRRNFRPRG